MTQTHSERQAEAAIQAPPRAKRGRRTALIASAVTLVAAVAVVGTLELGGGADEGPSAPPRSGSIVSVTRTTLTERTSVEGELGYGTELPLPVKAQGTVTWLPETGATVERGGELLRVDDRPVILLYGSLPMYRDLALTAQEEEQGEEEQQGEDRTSPKTSGSPAPGGAGDGGDTGSTDAPSSRAPRELRGGDVRQFETNLAALGYTGFTVDDRFTDSTAAVVKRWQKSLGLQQTGAVGAGDVIYSAGTVRIGRAGGRPGSAVGENTLTYTGTSRKVVVSASAAHASWAVRGAAVTVTLPTGGSVKGTVASVGKQATAPEGGGGEGGSGGPDATIPVTVTLQDQKAVGQLESGPVTVEYVGREVKDVLTVPVSALVALAEGGHGLETEEGRFVAVKTGLFADGAVEVSGPTVREGLKVRIPE
ncbi:peptidoglycan-binding domain-containing protein [Streptomyces sp. NPDC002992]|uniref:peptidoglycan-binding domain-containing protein n=1 Tax=Streptomyces sp. NPDC002992 TaxID=3154273 RepID=UPI0033A98683